MFPQENFGRPSSRRRNYLEPTVLHGFELLPGDLQTPGFASEPHFNYEGDFINAPLAGTNTAFERAGAVGVGSALNGLGDITGPSLASLSTPEVGRSQRQISGSWAPQASASPLSPSPAAPPNYYFQTIPSFQADGPLVWMQSPLSPTHNNTQVYPFPAGFRMDRTHYDNSVDAAPAASASALPHHYRHHEGSSSAFSLGPDPQIRQIPSSSYQRPEDNLVFGMPRRLLDPSNLSTAVTALPSIQPISTTPANDARWVEQGPDDEDPPLISSESSSSSLSPSSSSSPAVDKPRDGEEIPHEMPAKLSRLRRRSSHPRLITTFSCNGQEGVRMDIAFKTDVLSLDDPTDNIFPANFSAKPQYRFFFPGYEPYAQAKYVKRKKGYLTRAEIVRQIAEVTYDFVRKMERINVEEEHEKWKVGKDGIQLGNLELIALKMVLGAGLQPVFRYRQLSA